MKLVIFFSIDVVCIKKRMSSSKIEEEWKEKVV